MEHTPIKYSFRNMTLYFHNYDSKEALKISLADAYKLAQEDKPVLSGRIITWSDESWNAIENIVENIIEKYELQFGDVSRLQDDICNYIYKKIFG